MKSSKQQRRTRLPTQDRKACPQADLDPEGVLGLLPYPCAIPAHNLWAAYRQVAGSVRILCLFPHPKDAVCRLQWR